MINKNIFPLNIIFSFILVLLFLNGCIVDIPSSRADGPSIIVKGKVTNSLTGNPITNAVISDGFTTVLTALNGEYRLKTFPGASHVFISVPEQYEVPMNGGMPQIFEKIEGIKDSVRVNFKLTPLQNGVEKDFTLLAVADPQVLNANDLRRFNNETIVDLKKTIQEYNKVYGITLGDLAFDSLKILSDMKQSFINTEIPFFHTIGNHDFAISKYDIDEASNEFVNHFGPLDYSFNRGNVHFIVMNNVFNYGVSVRNFGFSEEQIKWLKEDLQYVPKEKMLIVSVHIPVLTSTVMERKSQFLEAISPYNEVHILSGHWHAHRNVIDSNYDVYEHITGAACGMWWSGTVNKCGAPNGYGVFEISGNKMKNWYYKSVNYKKDHQITMIEPNTLGDTEGYLVANVWNADEKWNIELFEDGKSLGKMERFSNYAPEVFALNKSKNLSESTNWYFKTTHLYRLKATKANAVYTVKATDSFGNVYEQTKPFRSIDTLKKY